MTERSHIIGQKGMGNEFELSKTWQRSADENSFLGQSWAQHISGKTNPRTCKIWHSRTQERKAGYYIAKMLKINNKDKEISLN